MPRKNRSKGSVRIVPIKTGKLVKLFRKAGFEVAKKGKKHIVMRKKGHKQNLAIPNHPGSEGVHPGVIRDLIDKAGMDRERFLELLKEL